MDVNFETTASPKESEVGIDYSVVDGNISNIYKYLIEMEGYLTDWDDKFKTYIDGAIDGKLQDSLNEFRDTIKASVIDDFYTTLNEQALKLEVFSNIVKAADGGK